jgi:hypothetical protein
VFIRNSADNHSTAQAEPLPGFFGRGGGQPTPSIVLLSDFQAWTYVLFLPEPVILPENPRMPTFPLWSTKSFYPGAPTIEPDGDRIISQLLNLAVDVRDDYAEEVRINGSLIH